MPTQFMQMVQKQQQQPPVNDRGGRGGRGGRSPIIMKKYCWTHGLYTHLRKVECRNKASGHKAKQHWPKEWEVHNDM